MRVEEAADIQYDSLLSGRPRTMIKSGLVKKADERPRPKKTDPAYKEDMLGKLIDDLNKKLNGAGRELRCSVHKETGQVMVKVIDTDSGKTVREIPPEKSLDILAKILEQSGLLVDEKT